MGAPTRIAFSMRRNARGKPAQPAVRSLAWALPAPHSSTSRGIGRSRAICQGIVNPVSAARNPKILLRKEVGAVIRAGHPWIFRDALRSLEGLSPGDIVDVADARRGFVARGFADPGSAIGVRVLTLDPAERVDQA